jgi:hypothetical protein
VMAGCGGKFLSVDCRSTSFPTTQRDSGADRRDLWVESRLRQFNLTSHEWVTRRHGRKIS